MLGVKLTNEAAAVLSALPPGLRAQINARLTALSQLAERAVWQNAFTGVRGARTMESVLDGFALRYSVDARSQQVVLIAIEDRRQGGVRLPA